MAFDLGEMDLKVEPIFRFSKSSALTAKPYSKEAIL